MRSTRTQTDTHRDVCDCAQDLFKDRRVLRLNRKDLYQRLLSISEYCYSIYSMLQFCMPTEKLVSSWFTQQKPNWIFPLAFGLLQKISSVHNIDSYMFY